MGIISFLTTIFGIQWGLTIVIFCIISIFVFLSALLDTSAESYVIHATLDKGANPIRLIAQAILGVFIVFVISFFLAIFIAPFM